MLSDLARIPLPAGSILKWSIPRADSSEKPLTTPPDTPAAAREHQDASEQPSERNGTGDSVPATLVESYRRLADVFHEVLSEHSLDALLARIARALDELVPNDGMTFYEADEGTRQLAAVYAIGTDSEQVLADDPFPFGIGITGWAAEHREPVLANEAHLDPRVSWVADTESAPESLIVVPLVARGFLKGTLNIYRDGHQTFSADEFELAKRYADAAALAIDNAHIRATLEHQAQTDPLTGLWNHRAFHERLRRELLRASANHSEVALVMLDLDDFKKVNDVHGHAVGDEVLAELGDLLRGMIRASDAVCRIGGEEFAIIAPASDLASARGLAERIAERVGETSFEAAGPVTVSVGLAMGPEHAANPRELIACAEVAMMAAKARGKRRVMVFGEAAEERPDAAPSDRGDEFRSIAHLKMLHGVSSRLSRLNDVGQIGATIAEELRQLIDYHNCRVFVRDGDDLHPIAFRGELSSLQESAVEALTTKVGVGVTGHVACTGEPFLTGDAAHCGIGLTIPGTETIEESLLAVPLRYGPEVVGVVVVSKLGLDQFDTDDVRLLEVLAGHASTALVSAQLYEAQRREAEGAKALLELSRELASSTDLAEVLGRVAAGAARILGSPKVSIWLPTADETELECRAIHAAPGITGGAQVGSRLPAATDAAFAALTEPFLLPRADYPDNVPADMVFPGAEGYAVAPIPLEGKGGSIAVAVTDLHAFDDRRLQLLAGIASQAKLAITNAGSFATLERTFLSTVEALANALEAMDEETSSHARWICDMALLVGEQLGLGPEQLKRVELGALFHDIGKIGVPASILAKPGPLTDEERSLIEQHPALGERILGPIEQLEDVRPIVRACHERWDGKGYPDHLRGRQIPLEARIIFACDAFHAMTTDRPYRRALPLAEARRRLAEAAGSQFDPEVVEACLGVLGTPEPRS
jgi:diguanylate cyclase